MTDMRQLAELVDRASKRHRDASGRRLATIAQNDGFNVSHSTLNKIRTGTYGSDPSTDTLRAIAHLAGVDEDEVFKAAGQDAPWVEFENLFGQWRAAKTRLVELSARYARLRGISVSAASTELQDLERLMDDFLNGVRDWIPPWAAEALDADPTMDKRSTNLTVSWRTNLPESAEDALPTAARTTPPGYHKGRGTDDHVGEENQDEGGSE